jgi:hypothetical protein
VVAGTRSFFHYDLRYEVVPVWDVVGRAITSGTSPFWISEEYCGHPSLLVQEAPLFYPVTALLLSTGAPAHRLADLFSLFHLWLAGFTAYLLVRDWTASQSASLFGGVAWMLSSRVLQSALWPNAVAVSALVPLLLLGMARIARGRRRSGVLLLAASGGLALLAFRPQVLIAASPVLVAVAIVSVAGAAAPARAARDLVGAAALALAIGAPAILPSAALYPLTSRAGGLTREERDLRPITFHRDIDQVFLPVDGPPRWPEAAAYPGILAGLLFVAGIGFAARKTTAFPRALFAALALGGAVGLVFAFGERGPYGLFAGLPVLRDFRIPARYLFSWSLAVALGSALAAAHVRTRPGRSAAIGVAAVLLLAVDLVWHARSAAATAPAAVFEVEPAILPEVAARGVSGPGRRRSTSSRCPTRRKPPRRATGSRCRSASGCATASSRSRDRGRPCAGRTFSFRAEPTARPSWAVSESSSNPAAPAGARSSGISLRCRARSWCPRRSRPRRRTR